MKIIEEGQIQGEFNGFKDEKTIFEMQSGNRMNTNIIIIMNLCQK